MDLNLIYLDLAENYFQTFFFLKLIYSSINKKINLQ